MIQGEGVSAGEQAVQNVKDKLGPFVVAADTTRMPMVFTDAKSAQNEIVYANQSFLDLTGYEISDVIGLAFHALIAAVDRPHAALGNIAAKDQSTLALCCLRKDQTEFDASVLVSPVRDQDGELQQYFVCLIDLSEHIEKRVEERLRDREIYRHAPGFMAFTTGPNHRFTFANKAYETLIGRSDFIGQFVADVLPEIADQGFLDSLDEVYRSGERLVGKRIPIRLNRVPTGQEDTRYIDFVYEPLRDDTGAVIGLFCEGSDVTDVKVVSDELIDTQTQLMHVSRTNAMGTMAATLAHELNQPLAAISNYASGCLTLIQQGGTQTERLLEALTAIEAASDRAGKIIRSLREMTKRAKLTTETFDLGQALEESAHLVRVGGCADVAIITKCKPSIFVSGNKIQIQQVIVNLLRNACQAASESGRLGEVVAMVKNRNESPSVVITDNGLGLPESRKADMFGWSQTSKSDGMGIGLSICRTIAEGHGGKIILDKTGGLGTTVTLCLPALTAEEPTV